jgi:hypothetical protein
MRTSRRRDLTTPSLSARFLVCLFLISGLHAGQSTHDHAVPENLWVVSFSTSCKPRVQKDFERSVALLHSFAYSAAEGSFRQVLEKDPNCAIAHWGIAMTYFHQLWDPPIQRDAISPGREEIRRAQASLEVFLDPGLAGCAERNHPEVLGDCVIVCALAGTKPRNKEEADEKRRA